MKMKTNPSISKKVLGIFTVLLMNSALGTAQNENEIAARMIRYEVKKEQLDQFKNAVAAYVQKSILSKDNIMSEAYYEQENQSVIWLFERWETQSKMQKFEKNLKEIKALTKTALIAPERIIEVKDLEPLTKEQWRKTSRKGEEQLTIMLFADAKKGTEDNFMKVYHKAMPEFRNEPGVVTYQLSQLNEDPTQFVTFEKFRNKEAFEYHLNFPPIQPVIDFLNSSIKKQPFQDGIHNLIEFAPLKRE